MKQSPKRKLIFNEVPDSRGALIPEGYDGKILQMDNNGNMNSQKKI